MGRHVTCETFDLLKKVGDLGHIDIPEQEGLQTWLRQKGYCFTVLPNGTALGPKYIWRYWPHWPSTDYYFVSSNSITEDCAEYATWEEAMEGGLQHCLKKLLELKP